MTKKHGAASASPAKDPERLQEVAPEDSQALATPATLATLEGADDFTLINGIGLAIARHLYRAGLFSFTQLADLPPQEIAGLLDDIRGISAERIVEQNWIGQARELAEKSEAAKLPAGEAALEERQHYATFTVTLLLDQRNQVRRTNVVHIHGKDSTWPGWDESRLVTFIRQQANLSLAPLPPDPVIPSPEVDKPGLSPAPLPPDLVTPSPKPDEPDLEIKKVSIQEVGGVLPSTIIGIDQDWAIHVEWELSGIPVDMLSGNWLVQAYLESLGPGQEYMLPAGGAARVPLTDFVNELPSSYQYAYDINTPSGAIASGVYKLVVAISREGDRDNMANLLNFLEGPMVQFFVRR